jgi:hypothetical protein
MDTLVSYFQTRTASRKHREEALKVVKNSPEREAALLQLAFNPKAERQHIYAAWIWELFILEDLSRLQPHLISVSSALLPLQTPVCDVL